MIFQLHVWKYIKEIRIQPNQVQLTCPCDALLSLPVPKSPSKTIKTMFSFKFEKYGRMQLVDCGMLIKYRTFIHTNSVKEQHSQEFP